MLKRALQFIVVSLAAISGGALFRWWQIRQQRIPAPLPLSLLRDVPEDAKLTRLDDKTLFLEWQTPSAKTEITLRSMTAHDNKPQQFTVSDRQSLTIDAINPQERYTADITFDDGMCITVAERVIPLQSVPNFRDIGGYMTKDGQQLRWNRLYRASRLSNLTAEDSNYLAQMGIQLVCDLRTSDEVEAEPDKLPDGINFLHLPARTTANRWLELGKLLFTADYLPNFLKTAYCDVMLDQNPQVFKQIFTRLADADNYPMVLHCAAGKDRTGISSMLILSFLGVPDEVIIADYTQSNHYYEFFRDTTQRVMVQMQMFGISESDFDYLLIADGELMHRTINLCPAEIWFN